MTVTRIRWDDKTPGNGDVYNVAHIGHVGTVKEAGFIIGWCALPLGAEPDPEAFNDPTLCGYVVTMRGGSNRGMPDCPQCLAILNAPATHPAATAAEEE